MFTKNELISLKCALIDKKYFIKNELNKCRQIINDIDCITRIENLRNTLFKTENLLLRVDEEIKNIQIK